MRDHREEDITSLKELWQDSLVRGYFYGLFAVYVAVGLFAIAWISDPFDATRFRMIFTLTVPALTLFLLGFIFDSSYWSRFPKSFWGLVLVVAVTLFWGHMLFLNAVGAEGLAITSRNLDAMTFNFQERVGVFGWVYTTRF